MIRTLMASVALCAVLATGALAQSSSSMDSSMLDSSEMSSQMSTASSMESSMMPSSSAEQAAAPAVSAAQRTPVQILSGYTRVDSDQLATRIIGAPVYDGTATNANNLGTIKDIVLNTNGDVAAVVVGVGGFLGIGEKQVAVDYQALQWTVADDKTERFVLKTTKDELTNAPDFKTVDDQPGSSAVDVSSSSSAAM